MREIKFRAWHKGLNKMFSCEEMVEDQLIMLTNGQFATSISDVDPRLSRLDKEGLMVPIQYTGLKDKDGNEIYEGHILKFSYAIDVGHEDPLVEERSEIILLETMEDAWLASRRFVGVPYYSTVEKWQSQVEIIGNIYENPELLTTP